MGTPEPSRVPALHTIDDARFQQLLVSAHSTFGSITILAFYSGQYTSNRWQPPIHPLGGNYYPLRLTDNKWLMKNIMLMFAGYAGALERVPIWSTFFTFRTDEHMYATVSPGLYPGVICAGESVRSFVWQFQLYFRNANLKGPRGEKMRIARITEDAELKRRIRRLV